MKDTSSEWAITGFRVFKKVEETSRRGALRCLQVQSMAAPTRKAPGVALSLPQGAFRPPTSHSSCSGKYPQRGSPGTLPVQSLQILL